MKKLFYLMLLFVGTTTMCSQSMLYDFNTYENHPFFTSTVNKLDLGIFSQENAWMMQGEIKAEQQKNQNYSVIVNQRTNAKGSSSAMLTIGRGQSKQQAQHAFVLYSMATGPITRETVQMFIVREAILKD